MTKLREFPGTYIEFKAEREAVETNEGWLWYLTYPDQYERDLLDPRNKCCVDCGLPFYWPGKVETRCLYHMNLHKKWRGRVGGAIRDQFLPILAAQAGYACQLCGNLVDMTRRFPDVTMGTADHIVPISRGGSDEIANLQLAHYWCNMSKGARV